MNIKKQLKQSNDFRMSAAKTKIITCSGNIRSKDVLYDAALKEVRKVNYLIALLYVNTMRILPENCQCI